MRLQKSVLPPANFVKYKMQNAKCEMQNAKCEMQKQNAKCKFQNEVAVAIRGSLTCSYLQTTSSHFGRDL